MIMLIIIYFIKNMHVDILQLIFIKKKSLRKLFYFIQVMLKKILLTQSNTSETKGKPNTFKELSDTRKERINIQKAIIKKEFF